MVATIPEQFDGFLVEQRNAIFCVGRGPGRPPHATPVWFNYERGRFEVSITRTRAQYRHLRRAPEVTLVIDDPATFRTVIVEGRAEVTDDDASLLALAKKLRAKHRADEALPSDEALLRGLRQEQRVVVTVELEKVLSWAS